MTQHPTESALDLFGTAGIRGDVTSDVPPERALAVGRAVGREARERATDGATAPRVAPEFVLARDGRVTGPALAAAMAAGLESAGVAVRNAGVLPTPALAFASRERHGVMLTASHNPPADNGIKLFADGVEYGDEREDAVSETVADDPDPAPWEEWGASEEIDVLARYRDAVAAYARRFGAGTDDLRVAVDCGNGMAGLATPQVLRALGADVVGLSANVDGHFPGRGSKPTPESLDALRAFVADDERLGLGIGHDGDADRIVVVDAAGEVVHEDTVVAILAEHYTRATGVADPVVVTTPNASARIDERVAAAGGRVERVRLGALHEGIARIRDAADGGTVVFAAEPWKHIHPDLGGWIDGVASAAVLTRLVAAEGLASLRDPVSERPYRKVSVPCPDDAKATVMADLGESLPEAFPEAEADTDYGVRLDFPDGSWVLVRPSGTEAYVRLYAESESVDTLVETARERIDAAVDAASGE